MLIIHEFVIFEKLSTEEERELLAFGKQLVGTSCALSKGLRFDNPSPSGNFHKQNFVLLGDGKIKMI